MGYQNQQQADCQSVGRSPTNYPWIDVRDPTSNDTQYPIGKFWINTALMTLWYLNNFTSTGAVLQANWIPLGQGTSLLETLSDNSNTVVTPSSNVDAPPFNIQFTSTGGTIAVTAGGIGNPHSINLDLTGGGAAIEKVNLDTGTTPIVPIAGAITLTGATVTAGSNPIRTDGTAVSTAAIEVQFTQAIGATDATKVGLAAFDSSVFTVDGNGFVGLVSGGVDLHAARFIVSAGGTPDGANFTTIGAAYAAAAFAGAPQTVFIQPGFYTENLTLVPGIDISAFSCDASLNGNANVVIKGKLSYSSTGTVSISGVELRTNGDYFLEITGANDSSINLMECYLNCTDNTGIHYTSTGTFATLYISRCTGNLTTTGIAMYDMSSTGSFSMEYSKWRNDGLSVTASTQSAGFTFFNYNTILSRIVTSGTASMGATHCFFSTPTLVTTPVTIGGTGVGNAHGWSQYFGGTAPALTVTAPASMVAEHCGFISTNVGGAVTGTGTIKYGTVDFAEDGNSKLISVTTQESINGSTFTPGIAFGGSSTGITYSQQVGVFTRVNNIVYVQIVIVLTSKGMVATGTATVTGLPFTVVGTNQYAGLAVQNIIISGTYLNAAFMGGTTTAQLFNINSGGAQTALADTDFTDSSTLTITGFYFI